MIMNTLQKLRLLIRLDQNDLETVIPKMKKNNKTKNDNNKVRILKGKYRGSKAKIQNLNKIDYHADLKIIKLKVVQKQKRHGDNNNDRVVGKEDEDEGVVVGMVLKNIPYEDFSQIA
jgi:hypothetical protein